MTNLTVITKDEPRVLDTDLAESLGFGYVYDIRALILRNIRELEQHGLLPASMLHSGQRGRPAKAYYLNEAQALLICMFSRTPNAAKVRKQVIDVFRAYRAGKTVHVDEHYRRPPLAVPAQRKRFEMVSHDMQFASVTMFVPFGFACDVMDRFSAL